MKMSNYYKLFEEIDINSDLYDFINETPEELLQEMYERDEFAKFGYPYNGYDWDDELGGYGDIFYDWDEFLGEDK